MLKVQRAGHGSNQQTGMMPWRGHHILRGRQNCMAAVELTGVEAHAAVAVAAVWPVALVVAAHSHPGHAPRKRLDLVCEHLPLAAVAPGHDQLKISEVCIWAAQCLRQHRTDAIHMTHTEAQHVPGIADVPVVDDQAAALCIGKQATYGGQAGVLLPKTILVRAVHLPAQHVSSHAEHEQTLPLLTWAHERCC